MSKKGDHVLLRRLLVMTQRPLPFAQRVKHYRRQRQWLIDLEHLLDPEREPAKTSSSVSQAIDRYLVDLTTRPTLDPQDRYVAERISQVFRNFWWGLFVCYNVEGLPRTNNELERCIRQIKIGQRRVSGQKNGHNFSLRYGAYAALIDETESQEDRLVRLEQVDQEEFLKERKRLNLSLFPEQKLYRFRFQRADYLADLEARWAAAVDQAKSRSGS